APAHIVGDFALAVWDEGRRRLVLARDRFGVRPLYFVRDGLTPVPHFSTDLATLVTKGEPLDEVAINDFLLFGQGRDPAKTTYARIERVPPAHVAIFDQRGMRMQRYWAVPVADAPRTTGEAVDEFRVLFGRAVAASDRYTLFERWDDPHCRGLEPVDTPLRAAFIDLMRLLGERAPVILTGQGGDAVLYASHGYFIGLLRRGRVDRVVAEGLRYA